MLKERLTEPTAHYWPERCEACRHDLAAVVGPDDPEPYWHQVVEIPEIPATLSFLSGVMHASKRGIEEFAETVLRVSQALSTISKLEQEMSAALAPAHAEAQREAGCRFVERLLTVVQTLRLQKRPILPFLYESLSAHRAGHPAPKLLSGQ